MFSTWKSVLGSYSAPLAYIRNVLFYSLTPKHTFVGVQHDTAEKALHLNTSEELGGKNTYKETEPRKIECAGACSQSVLQWHRQGSGFQGSLGYITTQNKQIQSV